MHLRRTIFRRPRPPRATPWRVAVLAALNAAFGVTLFFMGTDAAYEEALYHRIHAHVVRPGMTEEDRALALMHAVHSLIPASGELLDPLPQERRGIKERFLDSGDTQLLGSEACGSYASALARLLQVGGSPVRMGQMRCGSSWGCHIYVETLISGRWIPLDALYDLAFRNADGRLATFAEVSANWPYFRQQVPPGYDPRYAYEGTRYTNWSRVPIPLPLIRVALRAVGLEPPEEFSLRTYVLNLYRVYFWIILIAYLPVLFFTLRTWHLSSLGARAFARRAVGRREAGALVHQSISA